MTTRRDASINSWKNPAVALARRTQARVRVEGWGEFKNVGEAFRMLKLPGKFVIQFRAEVNRVGSATFTQEDGRAFTFSVVQKSQ